MVASNTSLRRASSPELLGCRVPPLCLRLHGGAVDGQHVRLESAKVSIGGAAGCTLRLRSPGSLPLYAWILRGPEGCVVRRFVPQVTLNGGAFDEATLQNGDRLRIGGLEIEVLSGARSATGGDSEETLESQENDSETAATLDVDEADERENDSTTTDPWARSLRRAFASGSRVTKQQRRILRQHLGRRTRRLVESLRRRQAELGRLQQALEQKQAEAAQLAAAQRSSAEEERVQLEEEARELSRLVEQMSAELREATAQRAGLHNELGDQNKLRSQLEQREAELARAREEIDEIRSSTAAQIEQLKHAFELVRQERDELAERAERQDNLDRLNRQQTESLQAELTAAVEMRKSLQTELDLLKAEFAAAEQRNGEQQPKLEQQIEFLRSEIARRDEELAEARAAASAQSEKLLASLDQLREELAELQKVRQNEREQNTAEAARLADELAAQRTLLAQREAELRTLRTTGETQSAELQNELSRLHAELEHSRQQFTAERSETTASRQQLEAKLASLEQQLERRTADLRTAQQTAAAEAEQFNKAIEQLRSDLQAERALRQQEVEARQADRLRAEQELAAARQEAEERGNELADLHRKLTSENSRLTLQYDQIEREARDLQAKFAAEQANWTEQIERLQQTVRELTSDRAASQSQFDQMTREASELQGAAADQTRELDEQNQQLRQQVNELQATLDETRAELERLQNQSAAAAEGEGVASLAASATSGETLEEVNAAQERLAEMQRQFDLEKQEWQQQRETWEASLRQREEELAVHVAELEEQVRQWQALQAQQQPQELHHPQLEQQQIENAVAALHQNLTRGEDPIYGSYSPPRSELPPEVTLPIPDDPGIVEIDRPLEDTYNPTVPVEFLNRLRDEHQSAEYAAEEPAAEATGDSYATAEDAAAADSAADESVNDSDSVSAVLNRLMQAGIWNANGGESSEHSEQRTAEPSAETPAEGLSGYERSYLNESSELPQHYEPAPADEEVEDIGCTMDAASLMAARGESAKSWRAQLLGEDEAEDSSANSSYAPSSYGEASAYGEQPEYASHAEEREENVGLSSSGLPHQAVGHGSWRAQMLGESAVAEAAEETPSYGASFAAQEQAEQHDAETPACDASAYGSTSFQESPSYGSVSPYNESSFAATQSPAAESSDSTGDDEDSIEAYMSKLLKRVRGDSAESAWKPAAPAPEPVELPVTQLKPANPVPPSEYVPQRQAPEATVSLAAMRELANAASRVAIDTHAKRHYTQRFAHRIIKAAMALITMTGFLVWAYYGGGRGALCGAAVCVLMMCWWSASSVWSMIKALRLKPAALISELAEPDNTQTSHQAQCDNQAPAESQPLTGEQLL